MAPNQGGDPLGSILGPMGSHWVQKMGQNRKNYHVQKFEFSTTPQSSIFPKKWGSIWSKRWVKTVKNYHAARFEFWTTPLSSIFRKNGSYGYSAKSQWGPSGSILGPMGSHWVKKVGQNCKKWPCLKIGIFDNPAIIDSLQKMEVTFMSPNQGGDPLGSIFGPMGSHWVKKRVKTVKNYNAPKFEFSIFPKKWKLPLWRQIIVGTP